MTITPDQARELLDGATPAPWELRDTDALMNGRAFHLRQSGKPGIRVSATTYGHNTDPELIAAAPGLARTIAGMTVQWGVQVRKRIGWVPVGIYGPDHLWASTRESAEHVASGIHKNLETRLVRRLVGPVEVAE